ncbi:MAG TPA: hypothetical protein PKY77_21495 [Phycisphaerae bacterium]|nr:hypothetical protein [Phycisphaerae bacterium]HRY66752.1 hypothetical protein [Phycisphaerae bacterium]HSA28392.1 hypothetical protein [Phycisphaerae bacterium]
MIRLVLISAAVVLAIGGGAAFVGAHWTLGWGTTLIVFAAGLNLLACWIGLVPVTWAYRRARCWLPHAVAAATGIRLLIVASVTLAAMSLGPWRAVPLAAFVAVFYFSLLVVETGWTLWLVNRDPGTTSGCAST